MKHQALLSSKDKVKKNNNRVSSAPLFYLALQGLIMK